MNDENLIPNSERSPSEIREMGIKGGKASGASRRMRKTLREALKSALACRIPETSPHYRKVKAQMAALGIEGEPTVQDIPVLGMIIKSSKDANAFAIVRDTIGEKPVETYEDITPNSPIVLGVVDAEKVAKAKAEKEARELEDTKKQ